MRDTYKLEGHKTVAVADLLEWATWFEKADRCVAWSEPYPGIQVSTVFLGIDHNFDRPGPPILFETMVFGGTLDQEQNRYCTWEDAEAGHKAMLEKVRVTASKEPSDGLL